MTQIASSPRGRQLDTSGRASSRKLHHTDPLIQAHGAPAEAPGAGLPVDAAPEGRTARDGEGMLRAIWRTSAHLEGIQWELDAAQDQLLQAVRQAAAAGSPHRAICDAANMTPEELTTALAGSPLAGAVAFAAGEAV